MPTSIVAGNWKMNTTVPEALILAAQMKDELDKVFGIEKVICPPFVSLMALSSMFSGSTIQLGAQNMHAEDKGAYTGEISSQMLVGICKYVILGHSERRQLLGETSDSVNEKMNAAIANGITPIVCIGETLDDRNAGKAKEVVLGQLEASISGIGSNSNLAIAYEPLWAIGTGIAATSDDAEDMMSEIRDMLSATLGNSFSNQVSLLYGGSVNSNNIGDYITQKNINGVLVGGASLDPNAFVEIAQAVSRA